MGSLLEAPLAIVDLETTGGWPDGDRVTEVALLEVENFALAREWSTLVNPGREIPGTIQALTGITQEMVEGAPRFEALAAALYERLAGRVFVAHNARFDYGFLRREFERAGIRFHARTLCTVRLSRRLYRGERGHSLDDLIARHGLRCSARHRAMGDAQAAWHFLQIAAEEHGADVVAVAARQIARQPSLPPHLARAAVDAVPEAPGVYILYGEAGAPLYIGRSRAMRSRILNHFVNSKAWAMHVRHIEWRRTAGELGALLRQAQLVKELEPVYNRRPPKPTAAAEWPHRGPVGIVEENEVHLVDRWCYLGTAVSDAEVAEMLERQRRARFDPDHYRILSRHLGRRGVRVVPL